MLHFAMLFASISSALVPKLYIDRSLRMFPPSMPLHSPNGLQIGFLSAWDVCVCAVVEIRV